MIRLDFVSNSSSSSHIIIADKIEEKYLPKFENIENNVYIPAKEFGNHCFGWEWVNYRDFWSKLNFCAIQLYDLKKYCNPNKCITDYLKDYYKRYKFDKCLKMLKKVCKEKFDLDIHLKLEYEEDEKYDYYIDHQSSVTEGSNMEMFDDEDKLYRFLGNENDSYIQGGNDNESPGGYDD